jgi:CheY-like chemotaxis protein
VRACSLAALAGSANEFGGGHDDQQAAIATKASDAGLAILVAEDNEINALLARALLTRLGHRVTMASSGDATVDAWRAAQSAGRPYDIVLMDVHMPGSDGIDATRRIREAEANGRRTPIVALTANAFEEDREACLAAGMDGFLTKPLDRDRLTAALSMAVDLRRLAA